MEPVDVRSRTRPVLAAGLGIVIAALLGVSGNPAAAVVVLVLTMAVVARLALVNVHAADDQLDLRNFWRNAHVPRADLGSFGVEDGMESADRRERQRVVYAYLKDGECRRLSATRRGYYRAFTFFPARNVENEADAICARLNTWLKTGP